jgi:DNA-binding response OmpR family regulator
MAPPHPSPPAQLIAVAPDVQPEEFTLRDGTCVLGRALECQIVVSERNLVSRLHARIERMGPRYMLHDTNSANGVFVNHRRITEPHLLVDRDLIGLGGPAPLLRFVDADPTGRATAPLQYDERTMTFFVGQQPIDLPPLLFRLMLHLYHHAGELCSREECAAALWGRDYDPGVDADALDRAIYNLRARLRQAAPDADWIQNRRGLGYLLVL